MSVLDRGPRGNILSPFSSESGVSLGSIAYSNERIPTAFNGNAEAAIDYIFNHLFPKYIATVATPGALPGSASANDYYIVSDDGDGKSAGYIWQIIDGAGAFYKRYDVDWSMEGIYAETINRTAYMYYHKYGMTDRDAAGVDIVGTYAGQRIYGGDATGQNLTLNANSADTTGFVQTDNHFRPTANNTLDIGTTALKFRTGYFGTSVLAGTMTLASGSITDTGGAISFGDENLTTAGDITGQNLHVNNEIHIDTDGLVLSNGSITSDTGSIDFSSSDLTTTGIITAASGSVLGDITFTDGGINSASGTIDFGANDLTTTGEVTASAFNGGTMSVTSLDVDNINLDGNTISITNTNGNLILTANGTGVVDIQKAMTTLGQTVTGTLSVTGQVNADNLRLDANVLSATDTNGNVTLQPNGTGVVEVTASIVPNANSAYDLGTSAARFEDLFMDGVIGDGTTSITSATIQSLRDINVGVGAGFSLFWDGSKWVSSAPDTEITHSSLSGLTTGDAGHTQFALLAGRAGGQSLVGGTAASELLTLESTAHATKGSVQTKDNFVPFTNASFSVTWSGTDLGDGTHYFRDLYVKGEMRGMRLENFTSATLPGSSAQNVGRAVWATDNSRVYVDNGTSFVTSGISKFVSDTSWNGTDVTKDVTVSSTITDARLAIWALHDNANDFERVYTNIRAISASVVRITVNPALPAGSYRLIGLE